MSDATIRASLKALMDTVTGIGMVHDYSRWAASESELKALFQKVANGPLHGWEITRRGFQEIRSTGDKYKVTHDYMIIGHYAIKDSAASEKVFNAIVDLVNQKIIDTKLANTEGKTLPKATIKEWVFGGVLCHRVELSLSVTEIVTATPEADEDLLTIALGQYLAPGTDWAMWTPATEFAQDAVVVPPVPNGRKYKCTTAGISGAAEPVWPVVSGGAVVDGTATWTEDGAVVRINSTISVP